MQLFGHISIQVSRPPHSRPQDELMFNTLDLDELKIPSS